MSKLLAPILQVLADGEFHSGEAIAQSLGVSRQAVNNALADSDTQKTVERVRGKGYRLIAPLDRLDAETIQGQLTALGTEPIAVHVYPSLASTNSTALDMARSNAWERHTPRLMLITCETQTGGRGRLGRSWLSAPKDSLTFSLVWRSQKGVSALSGLSLAVAVAIVETLESLHLANIMLKWPNDLMLNAPRAEYKLAKLGGILIETEGDLLGPVAVVIGIGINLRDSERDLATQVDQPVATLENALKGGVTLPSRNELLARLTANLDRALDEFEQAGFLAFRERWLARAALLNQTIRVQDPTGQVKQGTLVGIDESGALLFKATGKGAKPVALWSGDVSASMRLKVASSR